jgi:hypothetical protein
MTAETMVLNFSMSPDFELAAVSAGHNLSLCGKIADGHKPVDVSHGQHSKASLYNFDENFL